MTGINAYPKIEIKTRAIDHLIYTQTEALGVTPLQANLLAGRWRHDARLSIPELMNPRLNNLIPPENLKDAESAAERIAEAIVKREKIAILTDYDVDGLCAHRLIYTILHTLCRVESSHLESFVGNRLEDGYGLTNQLTQQLLNAKPSLLITADCGSSDEANIAKLAEAQIDVIVTDHHELPDSGPPAHAFAVVNPQRQDCAYPDKTIAGCMVAWLLMALLRNRLIQRQYLPSETPKLIAWLPWVALGTVADCVNIGSSVQNRAVIRAGLQQMNQRRDPCWQVMAAYLGASQPIVAETLAFQLGPRINASSRMASPRTALSFLLSETAENAEKYWIELTEINEKRKVIESEMLKAACAKAQLQYQQNQAVLLIYLENGHSGVQGIIAARLMQRFHRVSFVFTPESTQNLITGSARAPEGIALTELLRAFDAQFPHCLIRFGGHNSAAGLTLEVSHLALLQTFLNTQVNQKLNHKLTNPFLLTDGQLPLEALNLQTLDEIEALEPYGRGFEAPIFTQKFSLKSFRWIGTENQHLQLSLGANHLIYRGIWFNAKEQITNFELINHQEITVAFQLKRHFFKGEIYLQLQILASSV